LFSGAIKVHIRHKLLYFVCALVFAAGLDRAAAAKAGVICKLECAIGFEQFCNKAKKYVGRETRNVEQIKIYVDKTDENVFSFASNYLGEGADHPTKVIGFEEAKDIERVFLNLDASIAAKLNAARPQTLNAFYENAEIYLTPKSFNSDGSLPLNLRSAKNVYVIDPETGEAIRSNRLSTMPPPPVWVSTLAGCCVKGRPPSTARSVGVALGKMRFRSRDTKVLSLIVDTETETLLSKGVVAKRLVRTDPTKLTEAEIGRILDQHNGGTLVVLGHVEAGNYVVRDAANQQAFSIPIEKLRTLARDRNVQLIDLGCNTSSSPDAKFAAVSVAEHFRTPEAVARLEKAMSSSESLKDFLQNLSDEQFTVIVDEGAFTRGVTVTAGIYTKPARGLSYRVGEIGVTEYARGWFRSAKNWISEAMGAN
jgi:hypothetical protein